MLRVSRDESMISYDEHLHFTINQDLSFKPILVEERITFMQLLKMNGTQHPEKIFHKGLDIGTVTGFYPLAYDFAGMESYALNISKEALHYAQDKSSHPLQNSRAIQASIQKIPLQESSMDIVSIMTGTFSHLQRGSHPEALEEIVRILSPGGIAIISDWNLKAKAQNFCGWYTFAQQQVLRENHYGFPYLIKALEERNLEISQTALFAEQKMYMIAARKKME